MTEHETIAGNVYCVTCAEGCTVTDASGQLNEECEAGKQLHITAPSGVLFTSTPATVRKVNFKNAPVKLKLLGLLGGGSGSGLPSGYLAAEFLECNNGKYIWTDLLMKNDRGIEVVYEYTANSGVSLPMYACMSGGGLYCRVSHPDQNTGLWWDKRYAVKSIPSGKVRGTVNFKNDRKITNGEYSANINYTPTTAEEAINVPVRIAQSYVGILYSFRFSEGGNVVSDMIPALDSQGSVCMFDRVKKKTYFFTASSGNQSQPVIGMTLSQARKLSNLPKNGGSLRVSLPSNYAEDEGVVSALATAQENGWVITIQTYEAEAGAASTFALRRIWVRSMKDEQGSYVDSDGTRWQVEWCVDIVGADPEQEGYEPFRSVDVAVNYWGLTPWVDPEAEQELLTNNEEG